MGIATTSTKLLPAKKTSNNLPCFRLEVVVVLGLSIFFTQLYFLRVAMWRLDRVQSSITSIDADFQTSMVLDQSASNPRGTSYSPLKNIDSLTENKLSNPGSIHENYSNLLHYAIIGHPKTASTFTASWLAAHPELKADKEEIYHLQDKNLEKFIAYLRQLPQGKRGYKAPRDIVQVHTLGYLGKHFPQTRLIVGVRHPVNWFQSYYNYRAWNNVTIPPAETLNGPCHKSKGVCGFEARFHVHLAQLGKTHPHRAEENALLHANITIPIQSRHPIFLFDQAQLEDSDEQRRLLFRDNLSRFLGLKEPLSTLPSSHPSNNTKVPLDICKEQYKKLRSDLIEIGTNASLWIRRYFMHHPDVMVSSPKFFGQILEQWLVDPCTKEL